MGKARRVKALRKVTKQFILDLSIMDRLNFLFLADNLKGLKNNLNPEIFFQKAKQNLISHQVYASDEDIKISLFNISNMYKELAMLNKNGILSCGKVGLQLR